MCRPDVLVALASRPAMRSTEVKLVAELLSYEAESVEELAKAVIKALDQDRRKRDSYAIRASVGEGIYGIGPFTTRKQAEDVALQMRPDLPEQDVKNSVFRLIRPAIVEDDLAHQVDHYCVECRHPMVTHDWPKSKILGCVVPGCLCGKPTAPPV